MSDERRCFLDDLHLPPNTPEHEYAGVSKLIEAVDEAYHRFTTVTPTTDEDSTAPSPIVFFTHLSPSESRKLEDTEKLPGRELIQDKARDRVRRVLIPLLGTGVKTPNRSKQADASWTPKVKKGDEQASVALEVGFSEMSAKLKKDAEFLLNDLERDVRMVLTIDINRQSGNIIITSWRRGSSKMPPPRPRDNPEPVVVQEVKIERPAKDSEQEPFVTGPDPLIIPFRDIMRREADTAQGEGDFEFTRDDLLELAEKIRGHM